MNGHVLECPKCSQVVDRTTYVCPKCNWVLRENVTNSKTVKIDKEGDYVMEAGKLEVRLLKIVMLRGLA